MENQQNNNSKQEIELKNKIVFLYNTPEDLQEFQKLNLKNYFLNVYNVDNAKEAKMSFKYCREFKVKRFPFILVYKENQLKKIFLQTINNNALSEFIRYIHNEPDLSLFKDMFASFIKKCKNHSISKNEVINLINKYYKDT